MPGLPLFPQRPSLLGHACRAGYRQGFGIYSGDSNRADTEAKWSRINQRRPIINELRPRPPRVCIKTRLFVTHLSLSGTDQPRSAFVITLRRQTVSIRRRRLYTKARVGPAVSSRERATRGFSSRALSLSLSLHPFRRMALLVPARSLFD